MKRSWKARKKSPAKATRMHSKVQNIVTKRWVFDLRILGPSSAYCLKIIKNGNFHGATTTGPVWSEFHSSLAMSSTIDVVHLAPVCGPKRLSHLRKLACTSQFVQLYRCVWTQFVQARKFGLSKSCLGQKIGLKLELAISEVWAYGRGSSRTHNLTLAHSISLEVNHISRRPHNCCRDGHRHLIFRYIDVLQYRR